MTDGYAVSLCGISKKYRLFSTPGDRLKEALNPFGIKYHADFWALKDINLNIPKGQTIGILGKNGSGKSTLLQIISSVLQPSSGACIIDGRISALLELGAGFNPEFTGRDNVILSGALQGIPRSEMLQVMPEIEEFSDIGDFFTQPVKLYSSGMFVRVAFAAAIMVDPDILIVDEALAVGDAKFQHKCFDRFLDFQKKGKTIIFVSHNAGLIANHCNHAILLDGGELLASGEPNTIIDHYMSVLFGENSPRDPIVSPDESSVTTLMDDSSIASSACADNFIETHVNGDGCHIRVGYNSGGNRFGDRHAEIIDFNLCLDNKTESNVVNIGQNISLLIKVRFHRDIRYPILGFSIKTTDGIEIFSTNTFMQDVVVKSYAKNEIGVFGFSFPMLVLPGDYFVDLGVAEEDGTDGGSVLDIRRSVAHLIVLSDKRQFNGLINLSPDFHDYSDAEVLVF